MFGGIGAFEVLLFSVVALLLFGQRLPAVMRNVGVGIREFRHALREAEPLGDERNA